VSVTKVTVWICSEHGEMEILEGYAEAGICCHIRVVLGGALFFFHRCLQFSFARL
jgi:hypothetical protein